VLTCHRAWGELGRASSLGRVIRRESGLKDLAMEPEMADNFDYDVFVSYRHAEPDGSWVHTRLVPRLRADGLAVCIDTDSFRLGAPLVLEMERGLLCSRRTMAVISPRYLDSGFAELENVLAEHLGLERAEHRLIAVMYEQARPRLSLRARLYLDMTDPGGFEEAAVKLCAELHRDLDE
jgi:hypothetical protein